MTFAWPTPKPAPQPEPQPPTTPNTVVGRTGFRYDDCSTVEAVEAHLVVISNRIKACRVDVLIEGLRGDQDVLLQRRRYLTDPEAA